MPILFPSDPRAQTRWPFDSRLLLLTIRLNAEATYVFAGTRMLFN